jgi:hypothetical protein
MVFTYVASRTTKQQKLIRGELYPITYSGLKSTWKRIRASANVFDFRFHDFRHDFATKLLRETKNLKLVQRALNHADIKTTTKYAHVVDDEVAAGLEPTRKTGRRPGPQVARETRAEADTEAEFTGARALANTRARARATPLQRRMLTQIKMETPE